MESAASGNEATGNNPNENAIFAHLTKSNWRKMPSYPVSLKVWNFWHAKSSPSTITSRPAKLKVDNRNKIQSDLLFLYRQYCTVLDTVQIVRNKRNMLYYENTWVIQEETVRILFKYYIDDDGHQLILMSTFLTLKPFYIRSAKVVDIEMCCCKTHL